jgi:NADH:ubiquinone oxidoreductase subunit C
MRSDSAALSTWLAAAGIPAEVSDETLGAIARVPVEAVGPALTALRDGDGEFAFLVDLLGADTGEGLEVTYHLRSFSRDEEVYVRCAVPYDAAVDSVWRVYPAALYPEREAAELFGLTFAGHPNPKRLLTTDEVEAPLLRKAVEIRTPEEVHDR